MGLFSHQPKGEVPKKQPLPRLPDFPEMPRPPIGEERRSLPEFPSYEPTIREIKQEVVGAVRPAVAPPIAIPSRVPLQRPILAAPRPISLPPLSGRPSFSSAPMQTFSQRQEDKPLFVRIDDYKVALQALDGLKDKIKDAETLLSSVMELRQQEEQHLQKWQQELQALRSKLLTIDHTLFEV